MFARGVGYVGIPCSLGVKELSILRSISRWGIPWLLGKVTGALNSQFFKWSRMPFHLVSQDILSSIVSNYEEDIRGSLRIDLIHDERNTPFPFQGSGGPADSPRSAYELISLELMYFVQVYFEDTESIPSNDTIQLEACRIIFASEVQSLIEDTNQAYSASWLRDLITSNETITQQAQFQPIRSRRENRLSVLKINGKRSLFDDCPLEADLQNFVLSKRKLGQFVVEDHELQQAACRIVEGLEHSPTKSQSSFIANWLVRTISGSPSWLRSFKERSLPQSEDIPESARRLLDPEGDKVLATDVYAPSLNFAYDVTTQPGLLNTLQPTETGFVPPIPSNYDDSSNALTIAPHSGNESSYNDPNAQLYHSLSTIPTSSAEGYTAELPFSLDYQPPWGQTGLHMLNDCTYQERLGRALGRWAASQMSHRNPNCHVPSDEEIQHQARCMAYGE